MRTPYKLYCVESNVMHVRFNLFDPKGANCGSLCVLTEDVENFLMNSWKGSINWDGKIPERLISLGKP
jgi:hypothetical protein